MEDVIKVNKEAREDFEQPFEIEEDGIYLIEIIASAKNWLQNWKLLFDDDDLAVKIDDLEFPKLNGKNGLMNGEAAWNGNNLKGLKKLNIFIVHLKKGKHKIQFMADGRPFVESVKITRANNDNFAEYVPLYENRQAQDGDRRQWITIAIAGLPLQEIEISAKAEKREQDSDDIKLIIDGQIQKNEESKKFKNWFWRGSLDDAPKVLGALKALDTEKGSWREFKKEVNLHQGLHYIELWADRMPTLEYVKMRFNEDENSKEDDEKVMAKVVWKIAKFRSDPMIDEENVLGELEEGDEVEIIERAVKGDSPTNENNEFLTSNRWHKARWQDNEGYIFSMALEIKGEEKKAIKDFIIQKSKELGEDGNLMLAIAKRESKFFPYCVSEVVEDYRKGKGVMQITDQTRDALRDDKIHYDLIDPFNFKQNIEGGIIYFKYIRTLYEKSSPDYFEKLLVAWNAGPFYIPRERRDDILDYNALPSETREFIYKVKNFYDEYNNKDQAGFIKYFWLIILSVIVAFAGSIMLFGYLSSSNFKKSGKNFIERGTVLVNEIGDGRQKFYKLIDDLDGDGNAETINFHFYFGDEILEGITEMEFKGKTIKMQGGAPHGFSKDITDDGFKEVIVELAAGANGIWTEIYRIDNNGQLELIPTIPEYGSPGFFNKNGIKFVDYDDDGELEVRLNYNDMPDPCLGKAEIYEYIEDKFIKSAELEAYEPTCRESMKKVTG